jgi:protein arginine N-methyltransferase 2
MSNILFTNPPGAPDDEVALVCVPGGDGIMMEWERPISMSFLYSLLNVPPDFFFHDLIDLIIIDIL